MKKGISIFLVFAMCIIWVSVATTGALAFSVNYWVDGYREINEIHFDNDHQVTASFDCYIGDTKNMLTLKYGEAVFDRLNEGRTFDFGVYFLPDEDSVLETKITIDKLPSNGQEYCFIEGAAYWENSRYVGYSPLFVWGESKFNSQTNRWETEPIAPGKDAISLAPYEYAGTILDDEAGRFLDDYRVITGDKLTFSNPLEPKGIPYMKYYELTDGYDVYNFVCKCLVLTPKIADEILETGGHTESGVFYPLLQYFPELKQLILDEQAKRQEQAAATATPTSSTVLVDGKKVVFDSYLINDNNYFKLRDLAYIFSGTGKQFEVDWDGANNAIRLTSNKPYTPVGGEMVAKGAGAKKALDTTARVLLDGKEVSFTAYNIDGNNYFKLRDIGQTFNFGVDWDGTTSTITISTDKGYGEESPVPVTHPATAAEREKKAIEAAKQWAANININEFSEYTRAAMIYAYLHENVELQTDQSNEAYKTNFGNEAYAALVMKKAACSGFCKAVMLLCAEAGLESKHVNAGSWSHQWNLVLVDGQWLVLDAQGGFFGGTKHPLE